MWLLSVLGVAWAIPSVVVVGLHVPGQDEKAAVADAERLADALDETGKVNALGPTEVRTRIEGRQELVLNQYAMGAGREKLKEGRFLYDRAEPDEAVRVLGEAVDLLTAGLSISPDPRAVQEALVLLGLSYLATGAETEARAAFSRSLSLDPSWQLDPVKTPPNVIQMYEAERKKVLGAPPATVSIATNGDAEIWVDGRAVGASPLSDLTLVPGGHHVLVRSANGSSAVQAVTLTSGENAPLSLVLGPAVIGATAGDAAERSRQTRDLYVALGGYVGEAAVVLGGIGEDGSATLQLYSPQAGTFSKTLSVPAGKNLGEAVSALAPELSAFLEPNATVKSTQVSPAVVPLDISANVVLNTLLFAPPPKVAGTPREAVAKEPKAPREGGSRWWIWAGAGALVAAGGATTAVLLSQGPEEGPTGTLAVEIP